MSFSSLNWAKCVSQTGKIDRLIHDSDSKMAIKISSLAKKAGVCIRIVSNTAGNIHSFRIRSKETLRIKSIRFWI